MVEANPFAGQYTDAQLPFVLAGPILRRVESTRVCVWIAIKDATEVELTVLRPALNP